MFGLRILFALTIIVFAAGYSPLKPSSVIREQLKGSNVLKNALATISALAIITSPAQAANYGGFGSQYSEVLDPKVAVVNSDTVGSDEVKEGLKGLINLESVVKSIDAELKANSQLDVASKIKSQLDPGAVRTILNKYNNAFSEDTQRGTDRLIRGVIQDITELQRESQVKDGKTRSDNKAKIIGKRLQATSDTLRDLEAFYPK